MGHQGLASVIGVSSVHGWVGGLCPQLTPCYVIQGCGKWGLSTDLSPLAAVAGPVCGWSDCDGVLSPRLSTRPDCHTKGPGCFGVVFKLHVWRPGFEAGGWTDCTALHCTLAPLQSLRAASLCISAMSSVMNKI